MVSPGSPRTRTVLPWTALAVALAIAACDNRPDPLAPDAPVLASAEGPGGTFNKAFKVHDLLGLPTTVDAVANDISRSDRVVGRRGTSAFEWARGAVRFLPDLGGGTSEAHGINRDGVIVGQSENSVGDTRPVVWFEGAVKDLGSFGGTWGVAQDINDQGQVVGSSFLPSGDARAFFWQDGVMHQLDPLPGDSWSLAYALNDQKLVVGGSCHLGVCTAVRWKAVPGGGTAIALTGLNQPSIAFDVSRQGIIVGVQTGQVAAFDGFMWKDGSVATISAGSTNVRARGINDRRMVVGELGSNDSAFVWHAGTLQALPNASTTNARAVALNDRGRVVGHTGPAASSRAAIWGKIDPWSAWKRTTVPAGSFGTSYDPVGVDDAGRVAGNAMGEGFLAVGGAANSFSNVLSGNGPSQVGGISPNGHVTGCATNTDGDSEAFMWNDGLGWGLGFLPPPGVTNSCGQDVNDLGVVGGFAQTQEMGAMFPHWNAMAATTSSMVQLNFGDPYQFGEVNGINDAGLATGTLQNATSWAVRWLPDANGIPDPAAIDTLVALGSQGRAFDVNNAGQIVGFFDGAGCSLRAYLWETGTVTELLPNDVCGEAHGINDDGQIVGFGNGSAYFWHKEWMWVLPSLNGPPSGAQQAVGLNDLGLVVGKSDGEVIVWDHVGSWPWQP